MKDKKNKQKLKIQKALKLIYKRLPSTYPKVGVKIYNTSYSMMKAHAKKHNTTYKEMCTWYSIYLEKRNKERKDYINTKYYIRRKKVRDYSRKKLKIVALATNPIKINIENTYNFTLKNYIFSLLHEIGHIYYLPKEQDYNEKLADLFAIRWFKRIKI